MDGGLRIGRSSITTLLYTGFAPNNVRLKAVNLDSFHASLDAKVTDVTSSNQNRRREGLVHQIMRI